MSVTGSDIQKFQYCVKKAEQSDIKIVADYDGFIMIRNSDNAHLGKIKTLESMFQYLCGYEAGLDKGLADGCNS
jgi:hypothetical protein